jgi:hypothetical protein
VGDERAVVWLVVSSLWRVGLVSGVVSATAAVKHPVGCWHVHVCASPHARSGSTHITLSACVRTARSWGCCYGEILWSRHLWFAKYLWGLDNASAARHRWSCCKCLGLVKNRWCEGPDFILFCRGPEFAVSSEQAVWVLAWVSRRINEVVQVVIFKICEFFLDRNGLRGYVRFARLICL